MFDSKFHGHQSTKLQLSYEIMFGYVQKLQRSHLIPFVSYNKFFKPRLGRARPVIRPNPIPSTARHNRPIAVDARSGLKTGLALPRETRPSRPITQSGQDWPVVAFALS